MELFDDGQHWDGLVGDELYGGSFQTEIEDIFTTGLVVKNNDKNIRFEYSHNRKFTTIGPLVYASYQIVTPNDSTINPGETHRFKFVVKNMGQTAVAKNVTAKIIALDTIATVVSPSVLLNFSDISAGQSVLSSNYRPVRFSTSFQDTIDTVYFKLEIASDGLAFWGDSIFIVGMEHKQKTLPVMYSLKQNYPNPFNPNTTIEFALPKTELVTLRVYNVLGQQVASLVSEKLNPGIYKYQWQPDNLPSGIYYCRMEAGEYEQVRKMVYLK